MTRKMYTEEQIIGVLKESEARANTGELCRKHGISEATFNKWRAKYAGLMLNELKRLRVLELQLPDTQTTGWERSLRNVVINAVLVPVVALSEIRIWLAREL